MLKRFFRELWLYLNNGATRKWHPELTLEMMNRGTTWALITYANGRKEWREVCDFCHGNCGQCGLTGRIGNIPASMQAMIDNGNWASGLHAGLPFPS